MLDYHEKICYLCGNFESKDINKHRHLELRQELENNKWGLVCVYCGIDHWPIDCGGVL